MKSQKNKKPIRFLIITGIVLLTVAITFIVLPGSRYSESLQSIACISIAALSSEIQADYEFLSEDAATEEAESLQLISQIITGAKAEVQAQSAIHEAITFTDSDIIYLTGYLSEENLFAFHTESGYNYELVTDINSIQAGNTEVEVRIWDDAGNEYTASETFYFEELLYTFQYSLEGLSAEEIVQMVIEQYGLSDSNFSFFYYNTVTEETYVFNGNTYFTAASTTKLPLNMVYYDLIRDGVYTENATLVYSSSDYEAGAGTTASDYSPGDQIALWYLLRQSIVNSDNTAANILRSGLGGYANSRYYIDDYVEYELSGEFYSSNQISADYACDLLQYLYNNSDLYETLISNMKEATSGYFLQKNFTYCEVAHKYGSYNGYIHDYGIVYAESPYLIGVFTKNQAYAETIISTLNHYFLEYTLLNL